MADARLGAQSDEVLGDGSPSRQLAAISAESLTDSTSPSRQLSALSAETITNAANGSPSRQLAALSVEVLVPARLTFKGWGAPIKSPGWS